MKINPPRALISGLCALLMVSIAAPSWAGAVENAQTLVAKGDLTGALQALDDQIKSQPSDADARFTRGVVLAKLDRTAEAIKDFTDLTHDFPKLPEPYNNLAVLYAQTGDYDKSRATLESALATNPSYETAHENLGDVYAALAGQAYGHALMLDQGNVALKYKLSLIGKLNSSTTVPGTASPSSKPVAVAAAPISATAPVAQTTPVSAENSAALDAVDAWAKAWSARDIDRYLAAYSSDFAPEGGLSYETWLEQRRERLTHAAHIDVKVLKARVGSLQNGHLRVDFVQSYHSNTLNDQVHKALEFAKIDGALKIVRETVGH